MLTEESIDLIEIEDVEFQTRCDLSNQEDYIIQLIQAVREQCESITSRTLKPKNKVMNLDSFPSGRGVIEISDVPLRYIDSIKYFDENNVEQTIDSSLYRIITGNNCFPEMPSTVMPVYGESWPVALNDLSVISINSVCGYGSIINLEGNNETLNLPKAIKQWMLINIANLYNHPETIVVGKTSRLALIQMPTLADSLLANYIIPMW